MWILIVLYLVIFRTGENAIRGKMWSMTNRNQNLTLLTIILMSVCLCIAHAETNENYAYFLERINSKRRWGEFKNASISYTMWENYIWKEICSQMQHLIHCICWGIQSKWTTKPQWSYQWCHPQCLIFF